MRLKVPAKYLVVIGSRPFAGLLTWALLLPAAVLSQSPVEVLHTEGLVHGFLVLRTLGGDALADGVATCVTVSTPPDSHRSIVIEALEHARQYLRSELGRRLDIFRVPDLHFESAISATLQPRLSKILKRVKKGRPRE